MSMHIYSPDDIDDDDEESLMSMSYLDILEFLEDEGGSGYPEEVYEPLDFNDDYKRF